MSETPAYFARKLVELREKAGISSYRLAQLAGITRQALSLLESGQTEPNWRTVQKLAKALGVDCKAFEDPGLELPEAQPPGKAGRPRKGAETEGKKPRHRSKEKERE